MYISIVWKHNKIDGRRAKYDEVLIKKIFSLRVCNYVSIYVLNLIVSQGGSYMSLIMGYFLHSHKIFIWVVFFYFLQVNLISSLTIYLALYLTFTWFSLTLTLIFYYPSFDFLWFAWLKLLFLGPSSFGLKDWEWTLLRWSQDTVKKTMLLQPTLC